MEPKEYLQPDKTTLDMLSRVGMVAIIFIVPFAIYNFWIKNYILGLIATIIIALFTYNIWAITKYKAYTPRITFWILIPTCIFFIAVTIHVQVLAGILWTYPAILGFYCLLPEKKAYFSNALLLIIVIPVACINLEQYIVIRFIATLLLVYILSGIFINTINKQHRNLQALAITDPLTSLLNRTTLQDTLEQAIDQNYRASIPMSIAVFDLDNFKSINDQYGHDQGDRVLKTIAESLKKRCRKVDKIFRLGGEEFLIFFYNTDNRDGLFVAEECRALIANIPINNISVTASFGLATISENENWQEWIKRADEKQYQAKLLGGNRVLA